MQEQHNDDGGGAGSDPTLAVRDAIQAHLEILAEIDPDSLGDPAQRERLTRIVLEAMPDDARQDFARLAQLDPMQQYEWFKGFISKREAA